MSKKAAASGHKPARTTFEEVDPQRLVIGTNVRLDPKLDKDFVSSIAELGVLTPIVGRRIDGDRIEVVKGQRRTLAAVEAKLNAVPVMITEAPEEAMRLVEQLAENDHRLGVTNSERIAAYQQLALLGLSAAQIAKRTSRDRAEVDAALKISASPLGRKATDRWEFLTLDQAAAIVEFEGEDEAVRELVVAAKQGGFDHKVQRLRDERAEKADKDAAAQALAEAGITVVDRPDYSDNTIGRLEYLKNGDELLTEETHRDCPGHAAYLKEEWAYSGDDNEDGEADDAEDEDDRGTRLWAPVYVCTDFRTYGHESRYGRGREERKTAAEMTDTEREAARAQRRDVISANREWASAEKVRRQWLRTFLARKTAPKGTALFMAQALAHADHQITSGLSNGRQLALELFGIGVDEQPTSAFMARNWQPLHEHIDKATEARAQLVALGVMLASYEGLTSKDSWRRRDSATTRYLRFLQAQGYELSTVERRACGEELDANAADTAENSDE